MNSFGSPYFQWLHGFIFNEGGRYLTLSINWFRGRQFLFRLWISSTRILKSELEFKIDIRSTGGK